MWPWLILGLLGNGLLGCTRSTGIGGLSPTGQVPAGEDGSGSDDTQTADGDDGSDLSWDSGVWGNPGEASSPAHTAAELGALLTDHVEFLGDVGPHQLMPDYLALMAEGDSDCPGEDVAFGDNGTTCTSLSGYTYSGVARWYAGALGAEGERDRSIEGFTLADFVYSTPEGHRYVGTGSSERTVYTEDGEVSEWQHFVSGSWVYSESEIPWLSQGVSSTARVQVVVVPGGPHSVAISGAWGSGDYAISFDRLVFSDGSCPGTPSEGTIRLRQPDASWNYLVTHGDCSPCFDVTWQEELELGEVCVELDTFRDVLVAYAEQEVVP